MKKKTAFILTAVILLSGCEKEVVKDITEEDIAVLTEAMREAEQTDNEEKTIVINTSEASEGTVAELPENISRIDTGHYFMCSIAGEYICCQYTENDTVSLCFYDIESGRPSGKVDFSENCVVSVIKEGSDGALFSAVIEQKGENGYSYNRVDIYDDYSFKTIGEADASDYATTVCGRNIVTLDGSLVDADTKEVLVEAYHAPDDDYGFFAKHQFFEFPIDDNRFVYRTGGYESIPGFGYYDFSTGTANFFEGSQDYVPLGFHNEKIYAVKTVWDGFGTELYTFDLNNPEPVFFMENPLEITNNEFVEFKISEDGKKLVIVKPMNLYELNNDENGIAGKGKLCVIDIETGGIIETIDVPDEYDMGQAMGFIGHKLIIGTGKRDGIIVVDLK